MEYIAYVDGSYNKETEEYGAGVVMLASDGETVVRKISVNDVYYADHQSVAGEILAARLAIEAALEKGADSLTIYHDNEGLHSWADGLWQTNTVCTEKYADFIKESRKSLDIQFKKVVAHTGSKYNEMADDLAKKAVGLYFEEPDITLFRYHGWSVEDAAFDAHTSSACMSAIFDFYKKQKHTFSDYMKIRAPRDRYNQMHYDSLIMGVDEGTIEKVETSGLPANSILSAYRWYRRGLLAEHAIRKVEVENEIAEKKNRK